MKLNKKTIALIMVFAIIANFSLLGIVPVSAHGSILNITYDPCIWSSYTSQLEINKKWYVLANSNSEYYHISHTVPTIKYYFADESPSGYKWDDDISTELAEEIKTSYANSMKKWNNVYFYSYDSDGDVVKNKVIEIVEGTSTDHNLVIYPINNPADSDAVAHVDYIDSSKSQVQIIEGASHYHISEWTMTVNLEYFYLNSNLSEEDIAFTREGTGAHEIGHILGLRDIDDVPLCGASCQEAHHEELLMGYGSPITSGQTDITYKDLAGVAIIRGFHTDSDHKWLLAEQENDGTHKLICSICNGVKYVENLNGYAYDVYNSCGENHALSSGNMMAVGSYGTSDYYKCKYCRYVAPFSSIVPQNYSITSTDKGHKHTNNVDGLEYTYYEPHAFTHEFLSSSNHLSTCECGYTTTQSHSYSYFDLSASYHRKTCECGYATSESHNFLWVNNRFSECSSCHRIKYHTGGNENIHLGIEKDEETD